MWCLNTYSLVFTDGPQYVLTQRIHLVQNSEYTRTNDGVNVPCLAPPPFCGLPSIPLLLPLLLEVLLAGHVRVGVRVPLHDLGLVACLLQLVLEVQRLVAVLTCQLICTLEAGVKGFSA